MARLILIVIISFGLSTCIDPIDFEVPDGLSDSLVIQSRVVLNEAPYIELSVSRLFDFSPESRRPVSVRKAFLFDDENNEMELETRTPGFYRDDLNETTPIQPRIGQSYRIRIETFDNRILESTSDLLYDNQQPDQLEVALVSELVLNPIGVFVPTDRIQLSIYTPIDAQSGSGLYWEVDNVFQITDSPNHTNPSPAFPKKTCYITKTADVNEIYVLDPSELANDRIDDYKLLTSNIDFRFGEGLYYQVRQYSLSPQAFNYWNAVDILSEREGNLFDSPVGEIKSNFVNLNDPEDQVFGFFFATKETVVRLKVEPDFVGNIRPLCPPLPESMCSTSPGEGCTCGLCCDCLIDPDATTIKPDYWID